MSDFSTEAEVHLRVPDSDLRNISQQIESAVGTTEIGMTDGGTMSAQAAGGGGGGRGRRRARREYRWARERTNYMEDAVAYLEEIDDKVGEGGGGGGMLDDIVGAVVETGGDAAIETGDTIGDALIDTVTTGLGNVIGDLVPGGGDGGGDGSGSERPAPEVTVSPDINPTINTEISPEFNPDINTEINPEFNPDINTEISPEFNPEFDPEFSPKFNPEFSPEFSPNIDFSPEFNFPSGGGSNSSRGQGGSGRGGDGGDRSDEHIGEISIGGEDGINVGPDVGFRLGEPAEKGPASIQIGDGGGGSDSSQSQSQPVSIDHSPRYDVVVEPNTADIADEVVSELEDRIEQDLSEIRSDVEDVEKRFDKLGRRVSRR